MSVVFQATGGQDSMLRVWVLKSAYSYFDNMRQKYSEGNTWEGGREGGGLL